MPFLSRGGGYSTVKEKNSRKPYQTVSTDDLFHIRYFENGPLEPGYVKDFSIYKKFLATAPIFIHETGYLQVTTKISSQWQ